MVDKIIGYKEISDIGLVNILSFEGIIMPFDEHNNIKLSHGHFFMMVWCQATDICIIGLLVKKSIDHKILVLG